MTKLSRGAALLFGCVGLCAALCASGCNSSSSSNSGNTGGSSGSSNTGGSSGGGNTGGSSGSGSHWVSLAWTGSPSSGVVGYNIYRDQTSGGPYSKINTSLISGLTYKDTTVAKCTTYYYVATAVNASQVESSYSKEAKAVIPCP